MGHPPDLLCGHCNSASLAYLAKDVDDENVILVTCYLCKGVTKITHVTEVTPLPDTSKGIPADKPWVLRQCLPEVRNDG